MFGLPVGIPEILVILLVAVVLFGGKLPETARSLGKTWKEFQKGFQELREQVSLDEDIKKDLQDALFQEVDTGWGGEEKADEGGDESEGETEPYDDPYLEDEEYDEFYRSEEGEEEEPYGDEEDPFPSPKPLSEPGALEKPREVTKRVDGNTNEPGGAAVEKEESPGPDEEGGGEKPTLDPPGEKTP